MDSFYTTSDYFNTSRYLNFTSNNLTSFEPYRTPFISGIGIQDLGLNDDLFDIDTDIILSSNNKKSIDFKLPTSKIPKLSLDRKRNANSLESVLNRRRNIDDRYDTKSVVSSKRGQNYNDNFDEFLAKNRQNVPNKFTNSIDRRLAKLQLNTQIPTYKYPPALKQTNNNNSNNYFLEPNELRTKINNIKNRVDDKQQNLKNSNKPDESYAYYTINPKETEKFFFKNNGEEFKTNVGKANSADMDVTTVSSMLSSENQSPMIKSELNTSEKPFHPDPSQFKNSQNNFKPATVNYEAQYKQETIKRIKPITQIGDVAYGIDSIPQEDDDTKAEKEVKRKIYGQFIKERNNQLNLTERRGYSTTRELEDDKLLRYKTRQEYARSIKEINDDEIEKYKQKRLTKTILPLIEKKGSQLVKQKHLRQNNVKRRSTYADYVKERNQVLIEDQKSQRFIKQLQNQEKFLNSSYEPLNDTKDDVSYSKSFKKSSYYVNLKDD